MEILPENVENVQYSPGYINSFSTGFRIYTKPTEGSVFGQLGLFIDDETLPIDTESFDNSVSEYYLSSNTSTLSGLKLLLPEGQHTIRFKYRLEGSDYVDYKNFPITADYSNPSGELSYRVEAADHDLSVGDKVVFSFDPTILSDIDKVNFTFNGFSYTGVLSNSGLYEYHYTVKPGDTYGGLGKVGVNVCDPAGNIFRQEIGANFTIDGVAPAITIDSPTDGSRYNVRELAIVYRIDGDFDPTRTVITLDGSVVSANLLTNLSDGVHILRVASRDIAGNLGEKVATFEIDNSPPSYIAGGLSSSGEYLQGSEILFEGQTDPGTKVVLEIHSDILKLETTADFSGKFSFRFNSNNLSIGLHKMYLTLYDDLSNSMTIDLGSFEITASIIEEEPIKLSEAANGLKSDVSPALLERSHALSYENLAVSTTSVTEDVVQETDLAANNPGRISSATDTKSTSFNWTVYLLVIGLIAIAIAVLTAGYYGYELLVSNGFYTKDNITDKLDKDQDTRAATKQVVVDREGSADAPKEISDQDDQSTKVRW